MKRNEGSLRDLWDNSKWTNIQIIGVPDKEEKEKGLRKYLKRSQSKTSLTWERKESPKSRKHRVPYRIKLRRNRSRHILIKLTKIKYKEKTLKAEREKQQIVYKGIPVRLSANISEETLQAKRKWQDMKGKILKPRLFYPARISFRYDREINSFTDKQKLREFSTTKPALQQMLKELL